MTDRKSTTKTFLPLSQPTFHVLVALADGDKHGWAILKDVANRTSDKIRLSPGTLYGIIKRLLQDGSIAESQQRPPRHWDDERRRYYRMTDRGHEVLQAEIERMEEAVSMARAAALSRNPSPSQA